MDNWKITLDQDGAQPVDISRTLGLTLAVNVGFPQLKRNAVDLIGHQGDLDLSEIYNGQLFYNTRNCTVFVFPNLGETTGIQDALDVFMSSFYGQRIRLVNTSKSYMLIGRLTDVQAKKMPSSADCKLIFSFVGEPWRYALDETANYALKPPSTPSNQWATLTAGQQYATTAGFSFESNKGEQRFSFQVTPNTNFYRISFTETVNSLIEVTNYKSTSGSESERYIVDYNLPFIPKYDTIRISVTPSKYTGDPNTFFAVQGNVFVGVYTPTLLENSGKAVPMKIAQTFTDIGNDIIFMINNIGCKLQKSSDYLEYPQLVLNEGNNKVLVMATSLSFNQSSLNATTQWMNVKWRTGKI